MTKEKNITYFAAANGYSGFRSNFGKIFCPTSFSHIFILKGGPGTGKSTLMKSVHAKFSDKVNSCDLIYCSSDPSSLDGIILRGENHRVAILDGTSPHCIDPQYPGCIEEIVNLGEFLDQKMLSDSKGEILKNSIIKSEAYKKAYSLLKLAGECSKASRETVSVAFDEYIQPTKSNNLNTSAILIDSFGKNGVYELNTLYNCHKKCVGVVGLYDSSELYLECLCSKHGYNDICVYSSVFNESKIKAVYIKSDDVCYISSPMFEQDLHDIIDVTDTLDKSKLSSYGRHLNNIYSMYNSLLWQSSDEFKNASVAHFTLEEIYKNAMNFDAVATITDRLIEKIENILF